MLTLTWYLWVQSFNRTERKIGAYSFASQPFTSRVMSTIIIYCKPTSKWIYISGSPQHKVLAKGKSVKRKGEDHHDSCIKYRTKIKDRPFAEGSRGCHVLLWLDAQNLNAKECHFILPLVIKTFIMQSVTFISSLSQGRINLIFFALIDHTYLESNFIACTDDNLLEGSYSIHR